MDEALGSNSSTPQKRKRTKSIINVLQMLPGRMLPDER